MKRFAIFALLAAFVLSAAVAGAAEIKVTHDFKTAGIYSTNTASNFLNVNNSDHNVQDSDGNDINGNQDRFNIYSRLRSEWSFTPAGNDKIQIYMRTQIGTARWGEGAFALGGGVDLNVNRLYLDFFWPETDINIRAGLQPVALWNSSVVGASSAILDDNVAAVQISAPIVEDTVSVAVGYARATDKYETDPAGQNSVNDEYDVAYLGVPLTFEGISVTPFYALGIAGNQSWAGANRSGFANLKKTGTINWFGVAFDFTMIENLGIGADFNYGTRDLGPKDWDQKGWIADFAVNYTGIDWMTPKLLFAYGSGEDDNTTNGSERMPTISGDWGGMTDNLGDASDLIGVSDVDLNPQNGAWGVEAGVTGITFIEKLSNDVKVGYWQGTNSDDLARDGNLAFGAANLTKKDWAWEVDVNTKYQVYEELYLILELGYANLNADDKVWGNAANNLRHIYRGGLGVRAQF